ncbi:MAG: ATP-binding protein [Bryobacteraceae bacterium]
MRCSAGGTRNSGSNHKRANRSERRPDPRPSDALTLDGTRKQYMESVSTVALLIIDDFGMRKLPQTAAEDLLEIVMRRYERASTLLTSNRPVEDWGKLLADVAAVSAMLDRLLHHGHVL